METPAKKHLSGPRVRFSPFKLENIYTHFDWNNDPELNHFDSELPYVPESFGAFKKRFERLVYRPSASHHDFEVYAENGTLIGIAYVTNISDHNKHGRVGITIGDRAYWGKNYGREALALILSYCFDELGMHRVSAATFEYNNAWKRLVEWAGFTKEGVEREYLFRDDAFWDKETYGLLETEYRVRFPKEATS